MVDWYRNNEQLQEKGYSTTLIGNEAVKFIEANRDRPYFLYLAHHAVHNPVQAKQDVIKKYEARPAGARHKKASYAAMIESMDEVLKK